MTSPERRVRVRYVREFGVDMPPTAVALWEWIGQGGRERKTLTFAVDAMPPTVNHMYAAGPRGRRVLSQESIDFRTRVAAGLGVAGRQWNPSGAVLAMVFISSPHWVTQKFTMRDMDIDNRQKTLFDAIQAATGVPDYTVWEAHCWKLVAKQVRTTVTLVDLGDLIEWYK